MKKKNRTADLGTSDMAQTAGAGSGGETQADGSPRPKDADNANSGFDEANSERDNPQAGKDINGAPVNGGGAGGAVGGKGEGGGGSGGEKAGADETSAECDNSAEIADLKKKLAEAETQNREYLDRWQRSAAEFENYKRRTQNEMDRIYASSASDVIAAFLPVVDSIERAVGPEPVSGGVEKESGADEKRGGATDGGSGASSCKPGAAQGDAVESGAKDGATDGAKDVKISDPYKEGLALIERQLNDVLRKLGVKQLPGEGEQFDPNLHEAVMHIKDDSLGANVVCEVFQKGYTYKERVVRHSIVKVAN